MDGKGDGWLQLHAVMTRRVGDAHMACVGRGYVFMR
jgi:hypothetical protein